MNGRPRTPIQLKCINAEKRAGGDAKHHDELDLPLDQDLPPSALRQSQDVLLVAQ
jgi:hypothetical protein